jgi:hypothetical protein
MRDIPRKLTDEEPPAPADPSWVFSMLSEGLYFPPPDPSADPLADGDTFDLSVYLLMTLIVVVLLGALLLLNQLA